MAREHTDREYEQELRHLSDQVILMGARVEELLAQAVRALVERDSERAHRMIELDSEIDRLEVAVDEQCLRILARRQPVASDLRFITIALKLVTDLERIGDLGVNICERAIELNAERPLQPDLDLPRMAAIVQGMLREALDAFVARDVDRARQVLERDHLVDAHYGQVFHDLMVAMREDTRTIHRAIKIQSVAKYLERIGDHATNLAEMVVFMARGQDIRHQGRHARQAKPHGVLFLCVQNAVRSQLAEAWAQKLFPVGVRIWSAGSQPGPAVDPRAVRVMQEVGLDLSHARPKPLEEVPLGDVALVITLCAEEQCPRLPGDLVRIAWPLPDPVAAAGSDPDRLAPFRACRDELRKRLTELVRSWE